MFGHIGLLGCGGVRQLGCVGAHACMNVTSCSPPCVCIPLACSVPLMRQEFEGPSVPFVVLSCFLVKAAQVYTTMRGPVVFFKVGRWGGGGVREGGLLEVGGVKREGWVLGAWLVLKCTPQPYNYFCTMRRGHW